MATTIVPKYKFPKKPGEWPDLLHDLKEKRLKIQREADALEAEEKALKEHIIQNLPKSEASGVAGKFYKVAVLTKDVPQVKDWDRFYAYMSKTKGYDMLNKALNRSAVEARLDAGKVVPGVELFHATVVSLTKI